MPCHPVPSANTPPAIGAATVAIPLIAPIIANIVANSRAEYLSVAIERERTTPPAPATPCTKRNTTNCMIFCEKIHPTVENRNKNKAIINGR